MRRERHTECAFNTAHCVSICTQAELDANRASRKSAGERAETAEEALRRAREELCGVGLDATACKFMRAFLSDANAQREALLPAGSQQGMSGTSRL